MHELINNDNNFKIYLKLKNRYKAKTISFVFSFQFKSNKYMCSAINDTIQT